MIPSLSAGDMWGLGVVLLMLLNGGRTPFGADGPLAPAMPVDDLQAQLDAHLVRYLQEASNDLVSICGAGAGYGYGQVCVWRKIRSGLRL